MNDKKELEILYLPNENKPLLDNSIQFDFVCKGFYESVNLNPLSTSEVFVRVDLLQTTHKYLHRSEHFMKKNGHI